VHLGKPPLPPSRSYHWPLKYLEYVKYSDPDVHVRVFKVSIRINSEMDDPKIVNMFIFTSNILWLTGVIIILEIIQIVLL